VPEKGSRGLSIKPMLARDLHKERKVTAWGEARDCCQGACPWGRGDVLEGGEGGYLKNGNYVGKEK
jgi:hypothetical protein